MGKTTVLIADADASFREALVKELRTTGRYQNIYATGNMDIASSFTLNKEIDILITDLLLNGGDGIALLQQCQQRNPNAVILLLSVLFRGNVINHAALPSVDLMLTKPCSTVSVREALVALQHSDRRAQRQQYQLELDISQILREIGISPHMSGYHYLKQAICIAINVPASAEAVTKLIYPQIARELNTGTLNIERAIRYAIEDSWKRSNTGVWSRYFSQAELRWEKRPSNAAVIYGLAEYYKTHHRAWQQIKAL